MEKILDCTGMECPEPVVHTKNALEKMTPGNNLLVVVDNGESKHNVERFAKNHNCTVKIESVGDTFRLLITKGQNAKEETLFSEDDYACELPKLELVYIIPANTMGKGDDDLGRILMQAFIKTMGEVSPLPQKIFFYNSGVRLTTADSNLVEPLRELADKGVEILSCGTCLDFYNLKKELQVGEMTNMYNILEAITKATKTVTVI